MKIGTYHISYGGDRLYKQASIWIGQDGDSTSLPLVYFQRPKWVTNDDVWKEIVSSIRINLPKGFEVT